MVLSGPGTGSWRQKSFAKSRCKSCKSSPKIGAGDLFRALMDRRPTKLFEREAAFVLGRPGRKNHNARCLQHGISYQGMNVIIIVVIII